MSRSGEQKRQLQEALQSAFVPSGSLERMVAFELGENLGVIAGGGPLADVIFRLIQWTEAQGRVEELVHASLRANPGNHLLRVLAREMCAVDPGQAISAERVGTPKRKARTQPEAKQTAVRSGRARPGERSRGPASGPPDKTVERRPSKNESPSKEGTAALHGSSRFNWLHLTDLHLGMQGQNRYWPNIRQRFYEDLERLYPVSGPWHAVLFTGDLVFSGQAGQFKRLNEEVLDPLLAKIGELGSQPVLLAVPGNHDLARPDARKPLPPALQILARWAENPDTHEQFWEDLDCEYRQAIADVFASYRDWWRGQPYRGDRAIREGLLPGDFSTEIEIDGGRRIGIVGLNTTFLQLTGGNYEGKLAWDARQFNVACWPDGPTWVEEQDVCLLLTHQGPEWLDERSREREYAEINPAGRFAAHLFGHMHAHVHRGQTRGGGRIVWQWQGSSLFGLEHYGEAQQADRRHGYGAGRIEIGPKEATIRHWPRTAFFDGVNGWRFNPDPEGFVLGMDGGTDPQRIEWRPRVPPPVEERPTANPRLARRP